MTQLSLCMIVKNEEKLLPRCLSSVRDLVDEMVVVDTGSSDRTVAVAQSFGARVYHFEWCNNFAVARNEALQYVSGEWVLVLDADEVLTSDIVPSMQEAIARPNHLVVNLVRQEVGAVQSPYSLVSRLFRRHPQVNFSRPYHAMIDDSVAELLKTEPHWQIVSLSPVAIHHYGYQPEAIAAQDKDNRAKHSMEGYLAAHPDDPYVCSKLGALYLRIGQRHDGMELLERGLQSAADASVLFELHYHLANAYGRSGDVNRAAAHYQRAIAQPILPRLKLGAYNNLGSLLQSVGELKTAQKIYQTALNIAPNFALGYYNLGMTLKAQGKLPEAIAAYRQAIQLDPNYAFAHQNLGVILLKTGLMPASIEAFERAIALHQSQNSPEAETLRRGLAEIGIMI